MVVAHDINTDLSALDFVIDQRLRKLLVTAAVAKYLRPTRLAIPFLFFRTSAGDRVEQARTYRGHVLTPSAGAGAADAANR